jgi:predicted DNA-binding transcriptional regulator AlpA
MLNQLEKIGKQLEIMSDLLKQIRDHNLLTSLVTSELSLSEKSAPERTIAPADSTLLDVQDVMQKLGISESTYYRFVRNGELRPRKKGRRHYYYLSDLDAQLKQSVRKGRI